VRVKLSLAESELDSTDPVRAARARTMILESGRELESALHDLRLLAHGVFPRILADEGLASALMAAARQAAIPASVDAAGVGRLPAEIESAVYFCCLEALQNVAKHAQEARVTIRLDAADGMLSFSVADDGPGFDPATAVRGAGLQNMADRLGAVGGTLSIHSTPGEGAEVGGRVPVAVSAAVRVG